MCELADVPLWLK